MTRTLVTAIVSTTATGAESGALDAAGIATATRDVLVWVLEDDHAGAVLPEGMTMEPWQPFAGVDRSASLELLQHVAVPAGVDWDRAAARMAAPEPPPLGTTHDRPILAELERGLSTRRPATVPLPHSSLAALASSVDATGALTADHRTELEASIRQAGSEIAETSLDPELLLTLGSCPMCGRPHRPCYCECGHTPERA